MTHTAEIETPAAVEALENHLGTPKGLAEEEGRVYARIPSQTDYVFHLSFVDDNAEERYFGQDAKEIEIPVWTSFPEVAEDAMPARKGRRARLSADEEATLFQRYNYARFRLAGLIEEQIQRAALLRAREMILWFRRAMKARADIVRANLALVLAMAKRTRIPNVEFGEVVSEGNMALLRSVEKFDASRGFKFSTYACRAILKSFNRLATKTGRHRQRFPMEYDPEMERTDWDVNRHQIQRDDNVDALREVILKNRAQLTEVERTIILQRFGIGSDGRRRTLSEVGEMVGLTNERVRQLQNLALVKLRVAM